MTEHPHQPSFFPTLFSVVIFAGIMVGMFYGTTILYPKYVAQWTKEDPIKIPVNEETVSEQIAPFVRGILSGMKTAQLSSLRETKPLSINEIKGFQKGIKTAILTSKNWYNIDRQLFRARGIELGMLAAERTSKSSQDQGLLATQVKLIQRIQLALSTNLEELLSSNSTDRGRVLENYLNGLKKLSNEADLELRNMERIIAEAQAQMNQASELSEQFNNSFAVDNQDFVGNIDRNLDQYLGARRVGEQARVRGKSSNDLYIRLKPLAEQITIVIGAITANYEALAAGIKVAPTKGVNLPIFKEG